MYSLFPKQSLCCIYKKEGGGARRTPIFGFLIQKWKQSPSGLRNLGSNCSKKRESVPCNYTSTFFKVIPRAALPAALPEHCFQRSFWGIFCMLFPPWLTAFPSPHMFHGSAPSPNLSTPLFRVALFGVLQLQLKLRAIPPEYCCGARACSATV